MKKEIYRQEGNNCVSFAIKNAAERLWPDKKFDWLFIKNNFVSLYSLERGLKTWNRKGLPEEGEKNVLEHRIGAFFEITTLENLKRYSQEFESQPFLIAYTRKKVTENGVHRPETEELGSHAVCGVGLVEIDGVEYIKFENSFGEWWGDEGYGYIKFEDIEECYGIVKAKDPFDDEIQKIHFNPIYNTAWVFRGVNFERHDFKVKEIEGKLYCSVDDMFEKILKFRYKDYGGGGRYYKKYPENY